jgi:hypothetical protein
MVNGSLQPLIHTEVSDTASAEAGFQPATLHCATCLCCIAELPQLSTRYSDGCQAMNTVLVR